ncbi:hypothetical protein M9H77_07373 [Catharanthus roseus]|uniref:Uncharacterized protein n=1 Tax=Catharanthus roseus TaxID=4058 RepID=A0ACC0BV43_CATRO|nr:hypothetical protein M9H77_07373 [Catharanthus roseus]
MPYELFSWMVERFDHRSKCFKVHSRDVRVTEKYGETIIGLKKGKIKISSILKKGEVDESFEQELGKSIHPMMRSAVKRIWLPILKNIDAVKEMNWPKFFIDKLLARIKKKLTQSRSSTLFLERFSLVREWVVPMEKHGDEVDVVDAMGWPDDVPMNASYIHKRFEYFDNSLSEVKEDIKGVRDAIDVLASSVKSSQKSIGEAIAILLNKISNSNPDVIIE